MPGMTMSPSPSMEKGLTGSMTPILSKTGKSNLIGASNDLATVTITGVINTQNISYTNNPVNFLIIKSLFVDLN